MLMGYKAQLPLAVGDIISVSSALVQEPSPFHAAVYIDEFRHLFAELDVQALAEIEKQFHQNALDWVKRQARHLGRNHDELQVGDLVLELDAISGPLRGKARGPYTVKALKPNLELNAVVTLTTGDTNFKDRQDFDRNIGLLSKYYDKQAIADSNQRQTVTVSQTGGMQ